MATSGIRQSLAIVSQHLWIAAAQHSDLPLPRADGRIFNSNDAGHRVATINLVVVASRRTPKMSKLAVYFGSLLCGNPKKTITGLAAFLLAPYVIDDRPSRKGSFNL